jgi:hypothetical protein
LEAIFTIAENSRQARVEFLDLAQSWRRRGGVVTRQLISGAESSAVCLLCEEGSLDDSRIRKERIDSSDGRCDQGIVGTAQQFASGGAQEERGGLLEAGDLGDAALESDADGDDRRHSEERAEAVCTRAHTDRQTNTERQKAEVSIIIIIRVVAAVETV